MTVERVRRARIVAAAVILALLSGGSASATTQTAGPVHASAAASSTWSSASAATGAADDVCASAGPSASIDLTGFGLAIPAGAAIQGVSAELKYARGSSGGNTQATVSLISDGLAAGTGKNLAGGAQTTCAATTVQSLGGASDTWGASLTRGDVVSPSFGVRVTTGTASTVWRLDAVAVTVTYVPDTTPPTTAIVDGPSGWVNEASASISFVGQDEGAGIAGFECSLDDEAFASCTSPVGLQDLSDGEHAFAVRAIDLAGNVDPEHAVLEWGVDTEAPDSQIISAPSGWTDDASATIAFEAEDAASGVASFECSLDGGNFFGCESPLQIGFVADGAHSVAVRALDVAGNIEATPALAEWSVDTGAPETEIVDGPAAWVAATDAEITFTGSDSGSGVASFECSLDAAAFEPCTSPVTLEDLSEGEHTFAVRAIDGVGNSDASPATVTWNVDVSAPSLSVDTEDGATFVGQPVTITGTAVDTGVGGVDVTVTLTNTTPGLGGIVGAPPAITTAADGGWSATFAGALPGTYDVTVQAVDALGNQAAPITISITVVAAL